MIDRHLTRYLLGHQPADATAARLIADLVDTQLEVDGIDQLQQLLDALIRHAEAMFDAATMVADVDDLVVDEVVARRWREGTPLPHHLALWCVDHDAIADDDGWCNGCRLEIQQERATDR